LPYYNETSDTCISSCEEIGYMLNDIKVCEERCPTSFFIPDKSINFTHCGS